ncbi:hypothetical protein Sjap_001403 [Stephania japonica]|uniref:GDPGP1-like C-terminal domain-containing protein n=1 Tax=Stephania japonica TaxID=461633 RepID=A0AAP0PRF5_9MAGN
MEAEFDKEMVKAEAEFENKMVMASSKSFSRDRNRNRRGLWKAVGAMEINVHIMFQEEAELQEAYKRNAWHLLAEVSLSEERFKEVKTLIFGAFQAWKKNLNWT